MNLKEIIIVSLIFSGLGLGFMWPVVIKHQVAFPGDALIGMYYPWYQQIPVKNPLITDIFSQAYLFRLQVISDWESGRIPLWNPHTLSGYPLLANYASAAFYPLNILFFKDMLSGWNLSLFIELAGSSLAAYLWLRALKYPPLASFLGSLVYAYSGFNLVWWEQMVTSQVLIWLPLMLFLLETEQLFFVPLIIFFMLTAGSYQIATYGLIVSGCYWLWQKSVGKNFGKFIFMCCLGLGFSAIQLLPTFELFKISVRQGESLIAQNNYGLLPFSHLAKFIIPDFFGNPVTYNYWGFNNYQESVVYISIIGWLALIFAALHRNILSKIEKFALLGSLFVILLAFDNPVGHLIYALHVPLLSTSFASRWFAILGIFSAPLVAFLVSQVAKVTRKDLIFFLGFSILIATIGFTDTQAKLHTGQIIRNLFFPGVILGASLVVVWKFKRFAKYLLLIIFILDVFRLGWKYTPFVPRNWVFPTNPVLTFLQRQSGWFRVDSQASDILPANTWEAYGLNSASGYDPLTPLDYSQNYQLLLNHSPASSTRYTLLSDFDATAAGQYGIKYLISKTGSNFIDWTSWKPVLTTGRLQVLQNSQFLPLVRISTGSANLISFTANQLSIRSVSSQSATLTIAQENYPGWYAKVNNRFVQIISSKEDFQQIALPPGSNYIELNYFPKSFQFGLIISGVSFLIWISLGTMERWSGKKSSVAP